jgi:uncharacterized protein (TIGR00730 family)
VRRVCVFCGSSFGQDAVFERAARALGAGLAARGVGLVYGGGNVGLMGALADAALAGGGEVIGVIPQALVARELAHRGLSELRVVSSMHQRKALMAELAEAFIALPGGYGTLDELCEILTWAQLGLHQKACGLLNLAGYYDGLLAQIDRAVQAGFIRGQHRRLMVVAQDPETLLDAVLPVRAPAVKPWIREERC